MTQKDTNNKKKVAILAVVGLVGVMVGIGITLFFMGAKNNSKKSAGKDAIKQQIASDYVATDCIELGKYKGMEVSLEVTEDDINTEVESLLESHTQYEEKEGVAKEGDMIYADFEGYIDGKRMDSTCGSDYITIGSGEWLEGFEEAFVGVKTGESKKFNVDVPAGTYGDAEIDGHTVEFTGKLQYICGDSIVPEYNDEFVEAVSDYKTVKEYNAYLKEKLEKENEDDKEEYAWSEVVESSEIKKYPKSLLEVAKKEVLQGYYDMAALYGQSHDEVFQQFGCEDEQDFVDTQLDELAKDTVKEYLVSEAIAEKENIIRQKEDYEELLKEEYESNKDSYGSKSEFEKKNKEYIERYALLNKVKKWISKETKYTK